MDKEKFVFLSVTNKVVDYPISSDRYKQGETMNSRNENVNTSNVKGIKDNYLDQLHGDFQLISEIVLAQIKLASDLP